jgi:1-acyl-sn-glycerol-3-phosphate acyltransferase
MIGEIENKELPVLLISNHFSWWDGFFITSFNRQKLGKRFHVMMEEKQLNDNRILNYGGVYSIRKHSKDVVNSLQYTINLLNNQNNLVALFPQGKFESKYQHPLHFEKGLGWILKKLPGKVQFIFMANQVEYFDSGKPLLFMHFKEYDYSGKTIEKIQEDYNRYYEECFNKNLTLRNH